MPNHAKKRSQRFIVDSVFWVESVETVLQSFLHEMFAQKNGRVVYLQYCDKFSNLLTTFDRNFGLIFLISINFIHRDEVPPVA